MPQVTNSVLVIGASGFVGRHLVRRLLSDGRAVRGLSRDATRIQDLADAGAETVRGDMLDPRSLADALQSVEAAYICVHTLSPQGADSSGQDFMDVERTGLETSSTPAGMPGCVAWSMSPPSASRPTHRAPG